MYDHYFSNFGTSPVSGDICNDSAKRHPRFRRRRFLKVFTIYGHGGHLGQWAATILAIFHFPVLGRLKMKFEQHWPRCSRGGHLKFWTFFPYKCIGKQTWHCRKKAQIYGHYFRNFDRSPVPNDLCKDSAPRYPRFWRRRFLKVFIIYGHGGHLGQRTATILAIFVPLT